MGYRNAQIIFKVDGVEIFFLMNWKDEKSRLMREDPARTKPSSGN